MFDLPNRGIRRSVNAHNSSLEPFCDWLEANALFDEDELFLPDVVDRLLEEQVYDNQEFAWEFIGNAITVLRNRSHVLQRGYPIDITGRRLVRRSRWNHFSAYCFCLSLSVLPLYSTSAELLGSDRSDQGLLLEKLAETALRTLLSGWGVHRTGWSRESPDRLPAVAADVAAKIDASVGEPEIFSGGLAKEAGLDVVCFRPFPDGRGGYPCLLVQCASGASTWRRKRKEPDLAVWRRAVTFDNPPVRALVIPFAIDLEELRESTVRVEGLVLDRVRLLLPGRDGATWVSEELEASLVDWCQSRLTIIPIVE